MNTYHNGKVGLAQDFDDAVRFKQTIYTLNLIVAQYFHLEPVLWLFKLSFFFPCPKGAVFMLEKFSYAAKSVKHCVRPCYLTGRSVTAIRRQIRPFIIEEAKRFYAEVDLPTWFATLSLSNDATSCNE